MARSAGWGSGTAACSEAAQRLTLARPRSNQQRGVKSARIVTDPGHARRYTSRPFLFQPRQRNERLVPRPSPQDLFDPALGRRVFRCE
ncbi:hypothetical protein BRN27_01390, partial [Xanthomonas oryzae pv. oryzae]